MVDNAAATTGSGSLFIKKVNADGLVGSSVLSLPVAVSAQSAVAKYVIEAANGDSADYTIDLNPEAAAKDKNVNVGLYIMGYTSGGYAVAPAEAAEIAGITEVCPSSFPGMITADAAPALGGLVTVTGSLIPGFTGTSQVKVTTTSGIAVANRTITVKNTAPAITDVTFESVGTVTDTSLPISEVLQVKNIATNGSAGYGKIKIDDATGYIFYDVNVAGDGEDDTYDVGDVPIGKVEVKKYGTGTLSGVALAAGDITWDAGTTGKISIGVTKWGAPTPFKTIVVTIK